MKTAAPLEIALSWKALLLFATLSAGCGPAPTPERAVSAPETELRSLLNPATQPFPPAPVVLTAPPPPDPVTLFPAPLRTWLPPAETPEVARVIAGDLRSTTTAPPSPGEALMLATLVSPPKRPVMPVPPLAQVAGPDPERLAAWVAINPATEPRLKPPAWDRPQITTDPTAEVSRELALAPPAGMRETPPPFARFTIPDPYEQIAVAELRNPPPENEPPVMTFNRPALKLVETVAAK